MDTQSRLPKIQIIISMIASLAVIAWLLFGSYFVVETSKQFSSDLRGIAKVMEMSIPANGSENPADTKIWILPDFQSISEVAEFEITAYDAWSAQSINVKKYRDGKTALNRPATPGRTIAVDPRIIPFDSFVFIPGMGWRVAEDVGGAIKGYKIDVLLASKGAAMKFGRKKMHVLWIPSPEKQQKKVKIKRKAKK